MKRFYQIGYFLFSLWMVGISALPAQTRKDLAIFFPVTTYLKGSGWQNLPETLTECEGIAKDLKQNYGFDTEVLPELTKTQIEDKLAALAKQSFGAQDQLLLFFSMHGHFDELGEDGLLSFQKLQIYLSDATSSPRWGEFTGHAGGGFVFVPKNGCEPYEPPTNPEETACQTARRLNTLDAWNYYLDNHPQGICAEEAKDERAWCLVLRSDNRAAYQIYLESYPNGRHAPDAREKLQIDNMVLVRGGTFQMGSADGEEDEKPVHSVTVSDFYLGKYEVTVAEFRAFVEATSYSTDAEKDDGSYFWEAGKWQKKPGINWRHDAEGKTAQDNHPVLHVSWNDATAYCQWLSKQTGQNYRLPTEAEWEYAAGNGSKHTKYSWGDGAPQGKKGGSLADEMGATHFNWKKLAANIFLGYQDGFVATAPVGSFDPNDFGLYDMTGNVWEWCSDWYGNYPSTAQNNPTGTTTTGPNRVLRGGSWYNVPQYCRVAYRDSYVPSNRFSNIGFRLARTR